MDIDPFNERLRPLRHFFKALQRASRVLFGPFGEVLFEAVALPLEIAGVRVRGTQHYDERLKRLDDARLALAESLEVLDELEKNARKQKRQYDTAVAALQATLASKETAEQKLAAVQVAMKQDVGTFQALAGVPNLRTERMIGFASGVVASTLATALWFGGQWLWKQILG